jgi:hypothetical protein
MATDNGSLFIGDFRLCCEWGRPAYCGKLLLVISYDVNGISASQNSCTQFTMEYLSFAEPALQAESNESELGQKDEIFIEDRVDP